MLKNKVIGFIGAGKMGGTLIRGLLNMNIDGNNIIVSTKHDVERIKKEFNVNIGTNAEVAKRADIIIFAVQPLDIFDCLKDVYPYIDYKKLLISIVAGVKVETMRNALKNKGRFVRVMPNVAAFVNESVSAIYCGPKTTNDDEEVAIAIMSLIGKTVIIYNEKFMNAVTGLSGSGPAYIFEVIEAMADGGVKVGLRRADALKLAAQTVKGAAELVLQTKKHPAELKDMVASPGGTTIYGLTELERRGVRGAFIDAVVSATKRSEELGS